jgi:hypothetical protein
MELFLVDLMHSVNRRVTLLGADACQVLLQERMRSVSQSVPEQPAVRMLSVFQPVQVRPANVWTVSWGIPSQEAIAFRRCAQHTIHVKSLRFALLENARNDVKMSSVGLGQLATTILIAVSVLLSTLETLTTNVLHVGFENYPSSKSIVII